MRFKNECQHPDSTYIGGTYTAGLHYDVYVYAHEGVRGVEYRVCARYGGIASEYLPLGPVRRFVEEVETHAYGDFEIFQKIYEVIMSVPRYRRQYSTKEDT